MTPAHALESRFNKPINEKELEEAWKSSDVDDDEWYELRYIRGKAGHAGEMAAG